MTKTPIRKRGYYRALNRKEQWAIKIAKYPEYSIFWLLAYHFRDVDWAEEMKKPSLFSDLAKEKQSWQGGYIVIPFKKKNEWP